MENSDFQVQITQEQIDACVNNYIKERVRSQLSGMYLQDLIKAAVEKEVREYLQKLDVSEQVKQFETKELQAKICESVSQRICNVVAKGFIVDYEES